MKVPEKKLIDLTTEKVLAREKIDTPYGTGYYHGLMRALLILDILDQTYPYEVKLFPEK